MEQNERQVISNSTIKVLEALDKAVVKEVEAYDNAKDDDERRLHEARLKDLAKTINDIRSSKVGIDSDAVELVKAVDARKESKRAKVFDLIKTGVVAGLGLFGTILGIRASRQNMEVLSEYEKEHYIATTAEKKAVESAIDVDRMTKKFDQNLNRR